ncbi:MAG: UvrB/UvrC motif-containing protein, partial [Paramuribaculum sp.]|nr:UvrB/UvrC motif-containing protein [Paramuribaculum sp.]
SMALTIEETNRRRQLQLKYNEEHGITPQAIVKARNRIIGIEHDSADADKPRPSRGPKGQVRNAKEQAELASIYDREFAVTADIAADPVVSYMNPQQLERNIAQRRAEMVKAAKAMDFLEAARLRDEVLKLEKLLESKKAGKEDLE